MTAVEAATSAGPLAPRVDGALRPLDRLAVRLDPTGLLGAWQQTNGVATIPHCIDELDRAGSLGNLRLMATRAVGGSTHQGNWFSDSDIYKTLEAAAWEVGRTGAPELAGFITEMTQLLAQVQDPDGYINSSVQGSGAARWADLARDHEMYCAGHLIQAGIADWRARGRTDLLDAGRRFADLLYREFGPDGREGICGHPEIETALVELYRTTGEEQHLALARRMIELRGHGSLGSGRFGLQYYQDHRPVRENTRITGHAVRALYLAAGATDVAVETGDGELLSTMEALWSDMVATKAYVTGGLGSRYNDEAFGEAYELPPDRAYCETCAAVASIQWSWRLLVATGHARYADLIERTLYNAMAAGVSVDGQAYFYQNPLQVRTGAAIRRTPWHGCACCPPNVARLLASITSYLATTDSEGVQIHQYTTGTIGTELDQGDTVALAVQTGYPWHGRVSVRVTQTPDQPWTLSLRLPGWATAAVLRQPDGTSTAVADDRGYLTIRRVWHPDDEVVLDLELAPRVTEPHPSVDAVRGCVAVQRGPLVYCVEGVDLPDDVVMEHVRIDPDAPVTDEWRADLFGGATVLHASGGVHVPVDWDRGTHRDRAHPPGDATPESIENIQLNLVPYHLWANREPGAMRVWLPTHS